MSYETFDTINLYVGLIFWAVVIKFAIVSIFPEEKVND